MRSTNLRAKALLLATLFASLVIAFSMFLSFEVNRTKENIIETNTGVVKEAVDEMSLMVGTTLKDVWYKELSGRQALTKPEERSADSIISHSLESVLQRFDRIEGGVYFLDLDEFIGYSFPSIPSPKPAYGPPPRSYNIIRDQVRRSIFSEEKIIELHGFDPAVFPLGSVPLIIDGNTVGALWARTHIERELAASGDVTTALIYMTLAVSLLGFIIAITVSWNTKVKIDNMRQGLSQIKFDNAYRLSEPRGVLGTISHYINDLVTDLLDAQQRSQTLEKDLHQKDKMATLGNLIAGVAHEINTPISIIKTRVQIWERALKKNPPQADTPLSNESLAIVHHEIDRISKLVKRLLIFSRPVKKQFIQIDLEKLLREHVSLLTESATRDISLQIDDDIQAIQGDPYALEQVFTNIIQNSFEAAGKDAKVCIHAFNDNSMVCVDITDNGPGIDETIINNIFDPFFTTREDGTGLGLSISYEIVRTHEGLIRFENNVEGGATCQISFPMYKADGHSLTNLAISDK